jgi:hypothetical protein
VIWVYAICERPDQPPPRRRGLAQAPLEGLAAGRVLAVVTRHGHPPGEPALDALWAHERVIERLMADRAVLPLRFGTKFPDEEALRASLAAHEPALLAALDRVRGRLELGVRAMRLPTPNGAAPPAEPIAPQAVAAPAATRSGREYLLGKLADTRQAEAAAAAVHDPLAALAVAARRRPTQSPEEVLRAAYLVDRAAVSRFRAVVERLQREHADLALLCTGPWPPYSFVELGETTATGVPA